MSVALRARELDPISEVTVVVADAYAELSICGIPYYVSGEVTHALEQSTATRINVDVTRRKLLRQDSDWRTTINPSQGHAESAVPAYRCRSMSSPPASGTAGSCPPHPPSRPQRRSRSFQSPHSCESNRRHNLLAVVKWRCPKGGPWGNLVEPGDGVFLLASDRPLDLVDKDLLGVDLAEAVTFPRRPGAEPWG